MKPCSQRMLPSPAPEETAPNERLQSVNELAKLSSSFTELDLMCLALRQGSPIRKRECMCMSVNIIYLSSSKKQRLITPSSKGRFYSTSPLHSIERRDYSWGCWWPTLLRDPANPRSPALKLIYHLNPLGPGWEILLELAVWGMKGGIALHIRF